MHTNFDCHHKMHNRPVHIICFLQLSTGHEDYFTTVTATDWPMNTRRADVASITQTPWSGSTCARCSYGLCLWPPGRPYPKI